MSKGRLQNKVLVLIGGTAGLGRAAARACVREGSAVVVVGPEERECHETAEELGTACAPLVGDARDDRTAVRAIEAAVDQFGGFDALYHVAGGSGRPQGDGPLHSLTDAGLRYTLELNLESVILSNRAAVQWWLARRQSGSVLNVSSVLAFSPAPGHFATHAYAAAKAGILGLTKSAAAYYAAHDIRFNAIAPALVDTPMAARAASDPAIQHYIRTKQPLDGGRIGQATDLDEAVVFFLSDASRFVTGQVLCIDGGWTHTDGQYAGDAHTEGAPSGQVDPDL